MPGRSKLKQGLTQTSKEEGGKTDRSTASIKNYYSGGKRSFSYKKNDRGKIVKIPQMLTGGQAKIAAKAPPPDKITGEDFAVLRTEKKKVKPVKAVLGIAAMGALGAKMLKDKNKKAMALPGVGAAALLAKKKKEMLGKRMGGVMKAKLGAEIKPKGPGVLRPKPTAGGKPLKPKPMKPNKKMGGGMIGGSQMPGYSKGKSVKVKCKLGRNKPTKMY